MEGYESGLARVEGTEGVDGAGMDFFKKHKKKILIGAGLVAAGLGLYYLTKSKKAAPRRARSLSGVSTRRKRKATTTRRKRSTAAKRTTTRSRRRTKPTMLVKLV